MAIDISDDSVDNFSLDDSQTRSFEHDEPGFTYSRREKEK